MSQSGGKPEESKSFSQSIYKNHFGGDITQQYEPTFVKLDKQVRFITEADRDTLPLPWLFSVKFIYYIGAQILRVLQGERG